MPPENAFHTQGNTGATQGIVTQCANWFAVAVLVRHEKVVLQLLAEKGFETFLPTYKRRHQYTNRAREFDLPLFPGYIFCQLDVRARQPVVTTPGVLRLVGAGKMPVAIADDEISSIRRAMEANISMLPHEYWRTGQVARITSGSLEGIEGIVVNVKGRVRLVLSITLLQRSVLLEVDSACVEIVRSAPATSRRSSGEEHSYLR